MASVTKQESTRTTGLLGNLFQARLYKPAQGRIVRQIAFAAVALLLVLAAYEFHEVGWVSALFGAGRYLVLVAMALIGFWVAFRLINYPRFADFLIAVEAEMNKVSWPSKLELWRASLVVIFVIFAMALLLFMFDVIWSFMFKFLNIRYLG